MKKVVTALANPQINEKLKQYSEIEIVVNDIQYQEGIFELLEMKMEIDFILLSELLPGELSLPEFITKIQKQKNNVILIVILEYPKEDLENYLLTKNNLYIFYNNEIKIQELVEKITTPREKRQNHKLEIMEPPPILQKEEIQQIEQEIQQEYISKIVSFQLKKQQEERQAKIITICGLSGIGKTTFTTILAKLLKKQHKKILILDFDDIHYATTYLIANNKKQKNILQEEVEEYEKENKKSKRQVKIQVIQEENRNEMNMLMLLEENKPFYDIIFCDTSLPEENETIMRNSQNILFLTEANLLQLKKTKTLLDKYEKEWGIAKEKIKLICNRNKKDSIDFDIIKEMFKSYSLIGKIDEIPNSNTIINQRGNSLFLPKNIKMQYLKIGKEILKHPKTKLYYLSKIRGD